MSNQAIDLKVNHDERGNIVLEVPGIQKIVIEKPWHQTKVFVFGKATYHFNIDLNTGTAKILVPGYVIRLWNEGDVPHADYEKVDGRLKPEHQ